MQASWRRATKAVFERRRKSSWYHAGAALKALAAKTSVSVSLSVEHFPRFAGHLQWLHSSAFVSAKHVGRRVRP
jgi:hypothetical protein